jgi:hypothetical protein
LIIYEIKGSKKQRNKNSDDADVQYKPEYENIDTGGKTKQTKTCDAVCLKYKNKYENIDSKNRKKKNDEKINKIIYFLVLERLIEYLVNYT